MFSTTISSTANPFIVRSDQSIAVFIVVGLWVLILVLGMMYFRRWDIKDHLILMYCPDEGVLKSAKSVPTIAHLKEMREYLDQVILILIVLNPLLMAMDRRLLLERSSPKKSLMKITMSIISEHGM